MGMDERWRPMSALGWEHTEGSGGFVGIRSLIPGINTDTAGWAAAP